MSLVDYASSDEEDVAVVREDEGDKDNHVLPQQKPPPEKTHPPNELKLPALLLIMNSTNELKHWDDIPNNILLDSHLDLKTKESPHQVQLRRNGSLGTKTGIVRKSTNLSVQQSDGSLNHSEPSTLRLPDVSLLLDSPALPFNNPIGSYDHSSRVAAAMAQNASRKRDTKETMTSYPCRKIPRGSLPHSKNVPETVGGLLCPPQLSGRSNVVTEDINKLFTRRNGSGPSPSRSPSEC